MNNGKVTIKNISFILASGMRKGNLYEPPFDINHKLPNSAFSVPTKNMRNDDNVSIGIGDSDTCQITS